MDADTGLAFILGALALIILFVKVHDLDIRARQDEDPIVGLVQDVHTIALALEAAFLNDCADCDDNAQDAPGATQAPVSVWYLMGQQHATHGRYDPPEIPNDAPAAYVNQYRGALDQYELGWSSVDRWSSVDPVTDPNVETARAAVAYTNATHDDFVETDK